MSYFIKLCITFCEKYDILLLSDAEERSAHSSASFIIIISDPYIQGIFAEVENGKRDRGDAIAEIGKGRIVRN